MAKEEKKHTQGLVYTASIHNGRFNTVGPVADIFASECEGGEGAVSGHFASETAPSRSTEVNEKEQPQERREGYQSALQTSKEHLSSRQAGGKNTHNSKNSPSGGGNWSH